MSLPRLLEQQCDRLQRLLQQLEQEQAVLAEGKVDGERLQQIAEDKRQLYEELERAEQLRRQAQIKLGYSDDAAGAQQAAAQANCLPIWKQFIDLADRTTRLNGLNGELIQHRLHHNQHMLNILRDATGGGSLYGADGSQQRTPQRISSKA
ncbi:flagellar protein FlgN [Pseudidiomarina sp.]|uniref:flagella synthesis protein FlgN n=1 Tax=Pseudidiomarina sp. TaxID=2081707 RepID=UPI00299F28E7|nr:flagellar protein FlgN [Pseudidiomarina sp.]MDX1705781.1 flagellar protein FlgN [Pseudidiomarina sp.]